MKDLNGWQKTTIAVVLMVGVIVLTITKHESSALVTLGMVILAGIGVVAERVATVVDQTNGRMSQAQRDYAALANKAADMVPIDAIDPAAIRPQSPGTTTRLPVYQPLDKPGYK